MSAPRQRAAAFYARHRLAVADLGYLCLAFVLGGILIAPVAASAAVVALVAAALWPAAAQGPMAFARRILRKGAISAVAAGVLHFWVGAAMTAAWFGAIWVVLPFALRILIATAAAARRPAMGILRAVYGIGGKLARNLNVPPRPEILRCLLLASGTLWLMRGFARVTLNGTNDALWYATMLADMTAQVRAGVFPVWTGQSIYQFNGAVYPLRVAPAFHYLGALLDALTFHRLGTFALQNLLITAIALAGVASAYLCLRRLLPGRAWTAAGLAALFISCPGVIGVAYNMDLFMSWTTVPAVPLIWYATVRSFQRRQSAGPMVLLGAALGYCWWGHSPIALWSTLIAFAAQVVRFASDRPKGLPWRPLFAGAAAFGLVAAYPIGSVLLFPTEPGLHADSFQRATAGTIVFFLKKAFPGTYLPVSALGRSLGDFQVGYGLWAILVLCVAGLWKRFTASAAVPIATAVLLAFLLLPLPYVDLGIWSAIPAFLRNTTGNWVMNRLYLILAGAAVFGAAASLLAGYFDRPRARRLFSLILALACIWSFLEAGKFSKGSSQLLRTPESAVDQLRPENVMATRFSYLVFPKPPSTFTDGVADPEVENHLLAQGTLLPIATNAEAALKSGRIVASATFTANDGAGGGYIGLGRSFRIEAGRSYMLSFAFAHPDIPGVLQIKGPHLYREYSLPEYGGERAFGAGGEHAGAVSIWSTAGAQDITVHFVPVPALPAGAPAPAIGRASLVQFDRGALPVRVDSWIPYRARVRSPAAAWLETPRMFETGYVASVNRAPADVRKSPDGLVCVAVPGGDSSVELRYAAPFGLQLLFWVSLLSLFGFAAAAPLAIMRRAGLDT